MDEMLLGLGDVNGDSSQKLERVHEFSVLEALLWSTPLVWSRRVRLLQRELTPSFG